MRIPSGDKAMYTDPKVHNTLDVSSIPAYMLKAQRSELERLKSIGEERALQAGRQIDILDIGVGDGRVPCALARESRLWSKVRRYVGIDNSERMLERAREAAKEMGISDKVELIALDAKTLAEDPRISSMRFDLVICTYFTPGNFYPPGYAQASDGSMAMHLDLSENPSFRKVFEAAYSLLSKGGLLVLGSMYKEGEETRMKQEAFYRGCGMSVITDGSYDFSATREGFWSQRFSEERIRHYCSFAKEVTLHPLDGEGFAFMAILRR